MDTQNKLYISLAVLAVMGGALYVQNQKKQAVSQAHSLQGVAAAMPKLGLTEDSMKKVTKVVIDRTESSGDKDTDKGADDKDKSTGTETRQEYVLERKGDDAWDLTKPTMAKANANNVKSMLDNLAKLSFSEQISSSADAYKEWNLTDDKALHTVFYQGDKVVADLYLGDSGSRGQMTRIAGQTGVYAAKGFSKWVYDRDLKGWRDHSVWTFDDKNLATIDITNEQGAISLKKDGDKWQGQSKPAKSGAFEAIKDFKESGVISLVSAYKTLNAVDFAEGKSDADTGLDKPVAHVTFTLKDGGKFDLDYGKVEGSNRWVRRTGSDGAVSISTWSADWVTVGEEKFQDVKKPDPAAAGSAAAAGSTAPVPAKAPAPKH
ncbi:MAG TPA: DUF4340 domain-containing protein [Polyangiaceae bacterium]|nr:DUF4340 domain-containing protein [Polyangiaceae bacterium]